MARKKYARDYRLNESLDERGRIRTEAEYIGVYYRYVSGAETARGALKTLLGFTVLAWALFLCSLLPHSTASLTMYVMLPYLFTALPLGMMTAALLQLRAAGERLDHRTADLAGERVPACSLWMLLLPGLSLLGEGIALSLGRGPFLPGDAVFLLCAIGTGVCGWLCRRKSPALAAAPEHR